LRSWVDTSPDTHEATRRCQEYMTVDIHTSLFTCSLIKVDGPIPRSEAKQMERTPDLFATSNLLTITNSVRGNSKVGQIKIRFSSLVLDSIICYNPPYSSQPFLCFITRDYYDIISSYIQAVCLSKSAVEVPICSSTVGIGPFILMTKSPDMVFLHVYISTQLHPSF
jgi:hypothetical protein